MTTSQQRLRGTSSEASAAANDPTLDDILERFDDLARRHSESTARQFYEQISQILDDAGQVVSANGKRLTAQTLMEALAKIDLEFGADGRPHLPQLHLDPALESAAEKAQRTLEGDSELRAEFNQLLIEKRFEFRDREANRRLVG